MRRIVDLEIGDVFGFRLGHFFANDGRCSLLDSLVDVVVAVHLGAFHGEEKRAFIDFTGVERDVEDVQILLAFDFQKVAIDQYLFDFHFFSSFK